MPSDPSSPSQSDVLQAIADLFEARPSSAAFAHYPTLRIQTANLRHALEDAIQTVETVVEAWKVEMGCDRAVGPEFQTGASALSSYRVIAPVLVRNVHRTADFLLDETRPAVAVDVDGVGETIPSFSDFVRLGAASRAFLDAAVQASYQLATFDGAQLNYKFLQSLLSFAAVAPASLHSNIVSPEMQTILDAYVAMSGKEKKNSPFTKASHEQFPQRLAIASAAVGLPDRRCRNIELLFGFCSDFVHSGYVTILALGQQGPDVILGGPKDAFTPRAENFAELKQLLLAECAAAYRELLLPIVRQAIDRTLVADMLEDWADRLIEASKGVAEATTILHRRLVEPVREGLPGSDKTLEIRCICGADVSLAPPHREWDRFCQDCGSRFDLCEIDERIDYVVSAAGIGDVLGSDAPRIADLEPDLRAKLDRIAERHAPPPVEGEVRFALIGDLERCDEKTLEVSSLITSAPDQSDRESCGLMAFVATKSIERCPTVRVICNCGAAVDYRTRDASNVATCGGCGTLIGLLGVSGDGECVEIIRPDGSPGTAPILGRHRFAVSGVAIDR